MRTWHARFRILERVLLAQLTSTNTLPIRRLTDVVVGRPVAIAVAWALLPALTIRATRQEYTLLECDRGGAKWRFRGLESDFTAELAVDAQGLVRDYPGIARRLI